MDSRIEIARDQWIQNHIGMCGTCHYWQEEDKGNSCMNYNSPFAADWTDAEDGCKYHVLKRNIHF